MPVKDQALGCSKCRFSQRGCKRCKDPTFQKRQRDSEPCSEPAKRHKRKQSRKTTAAASTSPVQSSQEDLNVAPQPAVGRGTAETISGPAEHPPSAAASEPPASQHHQQTSKAPPPHSSSPAPAKSDPSPARSAVTNQQPAVHDNPSEDAAGAAAPSSSPTSPSHSAAAAEAEAAGTSVSADNAASQHTKPMATSTSDNATDAKGMPEASSEGRATSSQGTASGSRPSFLLMLQSKMEQRRQQRRESQSASDSSLSSVHAAGVSSAEKAEGSVTSGTQAAKAMTAPRHKVKQQRRRLAKKPAKTRGFLQAGADPRQALWHPPASPYGLLEEVLYEDPWKLLVACMLLNVTSGLQVRKVIWRLFAIWPTAEAAAGASDDTMVIVEKLIQPLGLFRKRTMAIKRFSQEYLTAQWLDPIELHGIGQYASDAYFMFCRGNWQDVEPTDKDLLKYQQWLHSTGGEGTGLERDVMPVVSMEDIGTGPELDV